MQRCFLVLMLVLAQGLACGPGVQYLCLHEDGTVCCVHAEPQSCHCDDGCHSHAAEVTATSSHEEHAGHTHASHSACRLTHADPSPANVKTPSVIQTWSEHEHRLVIAPSHHATSRLLRDDASAERVLSSFAIIMAPWTRSPRPEFDRQHASSPPENALTFLTLRTLVLRC